MTMTVKNGSSGKRSLARRRLARFALLLAALGAMLPAQSASGKGVIETYPGGQIKLQYVLDGSGLKEGVCQELYEDGQLKADMHYKAGKLQGEYRSFYPPAKPTTTKPADTNPAGAATKPADNKPAAATRPATTQPVFLPIYAYVKRLHVLANYLDGKLTGKYVEFDRNTRPTKQAMYHEGKLHGTYVESEGAKVIKEEVWFNGELLYSRSPRAMALELAAIEQLPVVIKDPLAGSTVPASQPADPKPATGDWAAALHRLMQYRYLCGVPYQDLYLTERANKETQAAAEVVCALGHLTHTPEKPDGFPDDKYELGRIGAGHSNLSQGQPTLEGSISGYMNDSDKSNIDRVGHRRWCINPSMAWTGFGKDRAFSAMYSLDSSRSNIPDWDFVAYPAAGLFPVGYFGARHAWSVSINQKKYTVPDAKLVKATIAPVRADFKTAKMETGDPLDLEYFKVATDGYGSGPCIIFRPKGFKLAAGQAYRVEITGLLLDEKEATIRYVTEFCDLPGSRPGKPPR
jgi:hypothetical protein